MRSTTPLSNKKPQTTHRFQVANALGLASAIVLAVFCFFTSSAHAQTVTVTYSAASGDVVNPDRGFYYPYTTSSSQFTPLNLADLRSRRDTPYTPFQGNYTVRSSLAFRHYVLDSLVNTDTIPTAFLDQIQADFDIARQAGVRLLLRFSYTITPNPGDCSAGFICPPYGDAPKARVLQHIQQLEPLLKANSEVISALQQGFVGTWGENYYSDHFGDPSVNANQGYLTNQNWADRAEVVAELLSATPNDRMVQVRYPQIKQRFLGGVNAPLTYPAITLSQAHSTLDEARLGFHNDCILASPDDLGTYADYGNNQSPVSMSKPDLLIPYSEADGQYVAVGGETCADTFNPQNNCASQGGAAVDYLESLSYSYLNSDYNNEVNNDWQDGGCMQTIQQRLGYRFTLESGVYPSQVSAGAQFSVVLRVNNSGFSAPYNQRTAYLVLRSQGGQVYRLKLAGDSEDSRFWAAGSTSDLVLNAQIPSSISPGQYDVLLHLSDESNGGVVANRAEYSIRFANNGLWEESTGFNKLNHVLEVSEAAPGDDDILMYLPAILGSPSVK